MFERAAIMKITDVKTVLLSGPHSNDPYVVKKLRTLRSAAFIEIHTDNVMSKMF